MIKTASGIDHHQNHLLIKMDTLLKQNIAGRLLKSKHAFHSDMMDPILQPFEEIVQNLTLHSPKIPLVSTVTGNFLTAEEALNPAYWSAHIRNTVQFANASDTLLEHQYNFLIDVGPGNTLTSFLRQKCLNKNAVLASAAAPSGEKESVFAGMLSVLGQLWEEGFKPDWKRFYQEQNRQKITLPSYVSNYKKYWVDFVKLYAN